MDLSKLSDEQLDIADKVARKAKEKGLNPDFVLAMVMIESGFDPRQNQKKVRLGSCNLCLRRPSLWVSTLMM